MENKVLIINDITGYGRVSTFAMLPIMSVYGLHPYCLPTSLVSNTMDYGSSEILDSTDFMKSTIKKWEEFDFSFNNICTGFINSAEQLEIIISLIKSQNSPFVLVDPIMADNGSLYPNMYAGAIECNRKLAAYADIIIPNLTEAEMLSDMYIGYDTLSDSEYELIIHGLLRLGAKSIVITGCKAHDGTSFNLLYSSETKSIQKIQYEALDVQFVGTGDVFSACLMSELLRGKDLSVAVNSAAEFVRQVILDNHNNKDHFDLCIEKTLSLINID